MNPIPIYILYSQCQTATEMNPQIAVIQIKAGGRASKDPSCKLHDLTLGSKSAGRQIHS